jgi:hypothetical protein
MKCHEIVHTDGGGRRYSVAVYSRRAALVTVYEKHSCLVNSMYLYVLVRTFQGILYWHVPVCTGMYLYVPVHTIMILPDPVQVYRIPDGGVGPRSARLWKSELRISRGARCCRYSFCCLNSHRLLATASAGPGCGDPEIAFANSVTPSLRGPRKKCTNRRPLKVAMQHKFLTFPRGASS